MKPSLICPFVGTALLLAAAASSHEQPQAVQAAPAPPPRRPVRAEQPEREPQPTSKLLWLDAEGGIENATLNTFTEDFNAFAVGFLPRTGTGPMGGAAVGVRFVFLT